MWGSECTVVQSGVLYGAVLFFPSLVEMYKSAKVCEWHLRHLV